MKLSTLAEKAASLPKVYFDGHGQSNWHNSVYEREVKDFEQLKDYVNVLRKEVAETREAMKNVIEAYTQLRNMILEAEIDDLLMKEEISD